MLTATFTSHIPEYMELLRANVRARTDQAGETIVGYARALVRVDTGSLSDSIDYEPIETGDVIGGSINAGNLSGGYKGGSIQNNRQSGAPVDYADDQEYGLNGHPFSPYMTPAAEQGWQDFLLGIQTAIEGTAV